MQWYSWKFWRFAWVEEKFNEREATRYTVIDYQGLWVWTKIKGLFWLERRA